jgi:hypothetical protein
MTNVIKINSKKPIIPYREQLPNTHITEPGTYDLSTVAIGIEMALIITKDQEAVAFLLGEFNAAVKAGITDINLTLEETRKYIDYLDILQSKLNSEWRLEIARYKYT